MIGIQRQSDFDSIGGRAETGSVALGEMAANGYDRAD
jgi:hypothetical protein